MSGKRGGATQARRLYDIFAELARRYQHRDVNVAAYRGLTVSQTHVLERLDRDGTCTMGELAAALFKSLSAVTRMVDSLARVPAAHRESVIVAVTAMLDLFTERQSAIYTRKRPQRGRVRVQRPG